MSIDGSFHWSWQLLNSLHENNLTEQKAIKCRGNGI